MLCGIPAGLRIRKEISGEKTIVKAYRVRVAQADRPGTELGGFKRLGQVLMFSIKTDEDVSRRVSLTN
jgi:hypothetical protein